MEIQYLDTLMQMKNPTASGETLFSGYHQTDLIKGFGKLFKNFSDDSNLILRLHSYKDDKDYLSSNKTYINSNHKFEIWNQKIIKSSRLPYKSTTPHGFMGLFEKNRHYNLGYYYNFPIIYGVVEYCLSINLYIFFVSNFILDGIAYLFSLFYHTLLMFVYFSSNSLITLG